MKAIRKSDGKVIEVREWRGASNVVYSESDMSCFYQVSELDFNVEETAQTESAVTSGWVCRDEHSDLYVVIGDKPKRTGFGFWENESSDCVTLPKDKFPSLTWQSDPLEVTVTVKPKKQ